MCTSNERCNLVTTALHLLVLLIILQTTISCSGGETATGLSSESDVEQIIGPITAYGSVVVNGIHFDTSNSQITIENEIASEEDLSIGMIVEVKGIISEDRETGTALSIDGKIEVKGFISEVGDFNDNRLIVAGQTVLFDDNTELFSDDPELTQLSQLTRNIYIEVSGYTTGEGIIYATFIRHKTDATKSVVKGIVKNYIDNHFEIGGLLVNITETTVFDHLRADELVDGLYVRVESTDFRLQDGLDAEKIKKEGAKDIAEGDIYAIDGIVTHSTVTVDNRFELAGHILVVDDALSVFENGNKSSIEVGSRLRIDGVALQDGTIRADYILFVMPDTLMIRTQLQNTSDVDISSNSLLLINKAVITDVFTIFKDDVTSTYPEGLSGFTNLTAGDFIEVRLYIEPETGDFVASKFTRKKYDERKAGQTEVEGYVDNGIDFINRICAVNGIVIDYSATDIELLETDVGNKIRVRGEYSYEADVLIANTLTITR
jgi:hypothetical protein